MKRRGFILALGGAALARPLPLGAQPGERVRRIGVLMLYGESDAAGQERAAAFRQGLEKLGWTVGRNVQIDYRWGIGDGDWIRSAVAELLSRTPDAILANGGPAMRAAQQANRTVPIIFIGGADPVAEGLVQSLANPGGNVTGFTVLESSVGAKLLDLLMQLAPRVRRIAVLVNPDNPANRRLFDTAAAAAQKFAVEVVVAPARETADIEMVMARLGREPDHGLIVTPDPSTTMHRKLIVDMAARYRLPTIYSLRAATIDGGLISYGVDLPQLFRQAAGHVDRVLRGSRPADLPVVQPTKFELIVNLKTAKALGLEVPPTLLVAADEVIE